MSARDFVEKDFYKTLGVPKDAPAGDIKKAYRTLAKSLHPDTNPGSEERFKEVSEAYDVLSDTTKKAEYDEARSLFGSGPRGRSPAGTGGFDVNDLFGGGGGGLSDVFGGLFGGGGARSRQAGPRRGGDLETSVTLSFVDAVRGAAVPLHLASDGRCETCRGTGSAPGTSPRACGVCGGVGTTSRNQGSFAFAEPCRACRGTGQVVDSPCATCRGAGSTTKDRTLTVRIPAGVDEGSTVRLAGRGAPGERGGPAGDLLVKVRVSPHKFFARKGDDLTLTVPVTFPEAALGAQIQVPTLEGPVTLKIPAGTASGRTFRVRDRGVVRPKGPGHLLVTVQVAVPAALSKAAEAALVAYATAQPDSPRAHLAEPTP